MDKELKKQRIRSLIEQGGYAELEPDAKPWWKWLALAAMTALVAHLLIDAIS
jgi:hypothetical protein